MKTISRTIQQIAACAVLGAGFTLQTPPGTAAEHSSDGGLT